MIEQHGGARTRDLLAELTHVAHGIVEIERDALGACHLKGLVRTGRGDAPRARIRLHLTDA